MRTVTLALILIVAAPTAAAAQAAPPVVPMPSRNAPPAMPSARAAGMPLQVSDLPVGTVTVRVVRGAFVQNFRGLAVTVETSDGRRQAQPTDAEGRATFTLVPGAVVRASASADGERLESELFTVPPSGGLRILLVAGGADDPAPGATGGELPPGHPPIAGTAIRPVPLPPADRGKDRSLIATALLAVLTFGTALIFATRGRRG
jgi:hypothetical protein